MTALIVLVVLALYSTLNSSPAQAQECSTNPPTKTIKIVNHDPDWAIYPVLTTGGNASVDEWMQACFKVSRSNEATSPFPRGKHYRLYAFPQGGLKKWDKRGTPASVTITLPLYTQLVSNPDRSKADQYIDWWKSATILLYASPTNDPPLELAEARTKDGTVVPFNGAVLPQVVCQGCAATIYTATSDLPKNHRSQLFEYTFGNAPALHTSNNTDPLYELDVKGVNYNVSYVNVAFLGVAMGPYKNDQVGYIGTDMSVGTFQKKISEFLRNYNGWPQYVDTQGKAFLKIPSTLEIMARLIEPTPPSDLEKLRFGQTWPRKVWAPIQNLRDRWMEYAGNHNESKGKKCTSLSSFCKDIIQVKELLKSNFKNYEDRFPKDVCGERLVLSNDLLLKHVYAWEPFISNKNGAICPPLVALNKIEETYGTSTSNKQKYEGAVAAFDRLNYKYFGSDLVELNTYVFNPWVKFVHGKYLNAKNVYAYSIDDAVGLFRGEADGFIMDVASTLGLENRNPAGASINVQLGGENQGFRFNSYRICKNEPARDRAVNPKFPAFELTVPDEDLPNCPVYLLDNKSPPQLYTFKIKKKRAELPLSPNDQVQWNQSTAAPIDCTGNSGTAPFQPSSKAWCCDLNTKSGVWAFRTSNPSEQYFVKTLPAKTDTRATNAQFCSEGQPLGNVPAAARRRR